MSASDIITGFLLNAPPGEFHDVVTDVRNLLGDDTVLNEVAPYTFREYNTSQNILVDSPQGHKVLVSKEGEVGTNEYIDPVGGEVITFDHFKQEVTGSRPLAGELPDDAEDWRKALDEAAQAYVANHYDLGAGAVYAKNEGGIQLQFNISSALFSPNNFYNGRWRSAWTVDVTPGSSASLTGHIRVNVHYYEDGNVQLNTNAAKTASVSAADPATFAKECLAAISKAEQDFHNQLEVSYDVMDNSTYKALRRALPMTRQKVQWAKISQYKLGQDLGK
jgi:capping protein alpha